MVTQFIYPICSAMAARLAAGMSARWLSFFRFSDKLNFELSSVALLAFFAGVCLTIAQAELIGLHLLVSAIIVTGLMSIKWHCIVPLFSLLLGLSWASYCFTQQIQNAYPSELERQSIQVEGQVVGLPSQQRTDVKFEFRVTQGSQLDGQVIEVLNGKKLLLSCYRCKFDILPKQHWRLTVRLKRPHGYASWGAFDYEQYLFQKQVIAKGYIRLKETNTLLERDANGVDHWRWRIGQRLRHVANKSANQLSDDELGNREPNSHYLSQQISPGFAVILALAIGDKSALGKSERRVFQDTGVSHLMAISGLHVGLVFLGVSAIFGFLLFPFARIFETIPKPYLVLLPALASAVLYSALAGFAISTQRALIMLSVYTLCRLMVRDVSLLKVLLISACLIVILSPWSVLDIGFWLSCGAVFIIGLLSHLSVQSTPKPLTLIRLQPMLWLGMSPLTILFFGQVSLLSPLINLVMVPLFCVILIPLTLAAVLLQQGGMGDSVLIILSYCFDWIYTLLNWLSQLPFASWVSMPWPWINWVLATTILLVLLSSLAPKIRILVVLILSVMIVNNPGTRLKYDELDLVLLDVGQGLAMVLVLPDYVLVYDTGPRYGTGFSAAEAVVLPYLRSRGIDKIDTLVISHADNDHIGGYQTVVDSFEVGQVISSRVDKLPNANPCVAGQNWQRGATYFSFISPDQNTPDGSNNRSCVLRIEHFETTALITGDIEKQVERYLLKTQLDKLNADILLVPHQGSKTSSTQGFIDAVAPQIGLIAAGYRNHYGHPHPDVVKRYSDRNVDLVSSIQNGTVLLRLDQSGWRRSSYRDQQRRFWHHQKKPNWDG